jgi:acetoin utilization protein AcuB
MYVKTIMKKDPVTISPEASFYEARTLIRDKGIRHLPVVDKKRHIVGILTDRDIRAAAPSDATTLSVHELHYVLGKLQVAAFMTPADRLVTVTPDTTFEKAVQLMHDYKIGCLPVLEGRELIGIVTETDVLETFVDVMGLKVEGTRLTLALQDEPGKVHDVLEVIKKYNINLISIYTSSHKVEGKRIVVIRIGTQEYENVVNDIERLGYKVLAVDKWPST